MGWLIRERRCELPRTAGRLSRERRRELPRTAGWLSRERRHEVPRTAGWESRRRNSATGWRARRRELPRTAGIRAQRDKTQEQTKDLKKRTKQNEVKGRRLLLGLVETRNTQTRKYFKIIVFNDNIKGRQGKVDTPGITSRPDNIEYKRQD